MNKNLYLRKIYQYIFFNYKYYYVSKCISTTSPLLKIKNKIQIENFNGILILQS